jgi:hypothetical protein
MITIWNDLLTLISAVASADFDFDCVKAQLNFAISDIAAGEFVP